jgi:hypothetical protein
MMEGSDTADIEKMVVFAEENLKNIINKFLALLFLRKAHDGRAYLPKMWQTLPCS